MFIRQSQEIIRAILWVDGEWLRALSDGELSGDRKSRRNAFDDGGEDEKLLQLLAAIVEAHEQPKPSKDDFHEMLSQTDALVYCGHGSGLNICADNVYNLKTKAIVFLFGCGSVALSSSGLNSELKGAHIFYHIGWSPVVIGFLWTVTDFNTDYTCTKMLSSWINSGQNKAHWQCLDKQMWKKNGNSLQKAVRL